MRRTFFRQERRFVLFLAMVYCYRVLLCRFRRVRAILPLYHLCGRSPRGPNKFRVQQRGQHFQAVHEAGSGPAEIVGAVDEIHPALSDGRQVGVAGQRFQNAACPGRSAPRRSRTGRSPALRARSPGSPPTKPAWRADAAGRWHPRRPRSPPTPGPNARRRTAGQSIPAARSGAASAACRGRSRTGRCAPAGRASDLSRLPPPGPRRGRRARIVSSTSSSEFGSRLSTRGPGRAGSGPPPAHRCKTPRRHRKAAGSGSDPAGSRPAGPGQSCTASATGPAGPARPHQSRRCPGRAAGCSA